MVARQKKLALVFSVVREFPYMTKGEVIKAVLKRAEEREWEQPPSQEAIHAALMALVTEGTIEKVEESPGKHWGRKLYVVSAEREEREGERPWMV